MDQFRRRALNPEHPVIRGWYRDSPTLTDVDIKYLLLYFEENYGLTIEKKIQDAVMAVSYTHLWGEIAMFLLKLLALPLVAVVTLIQWVAIFLTSFSAILFDLLAGIIFMITLAGLLFGVCTGMEALKMLAVSFAIFIIPQIAEWLIERIVDINYGLRDFIKS